MPTKLLTTGQLSVHVGSLTIESLDALRVEVKIDDVPQACVGLTLRLRVNSLPRVHLHLLPTVKTAQPPAAPIDAPPPSADP